MEQQEMDTFCIHFLDLSQDQQKRVKTKLEKENQLNKLQYGGLGLINLHCLLETYAFKKSKRHIMTALVKLLEYLIIHLDLWKEYQDKCASFQI